MMMTRIAAILGWMVLAACSASPFFATHTSTSTTCHPLQAILEYEGGEGELKIRFRNIDGEPCTAFSAASARAELILPDGKTRQFQCRNVHWESGHAPSGSYRYFHSENVSFVEAKEPWLKSLGAFEVVVWLPLHGTVYELKFSYPDSLVNVLG